MKKDGKDIDGGRCTRGKDGKLGFSKKDRKGIWRNHMEKMMMKKEDWDCMTESSM